jgi:hypothetical protein
VGTLFGITGVAISFSFGQKQAADQDPRPRSRALRGLSALNRVHNFFTRPCSSLGLFDSVREHHCHFSQGFIERSAAIRKSGQVITMPVCNVALLFLTVLLAEGAA